MKKEKIFGNFNKDSDEEYKNALFSAIKFG
jgi:hypothetical protein